MTRMFLQLAISASVFLCSFEPVLAQVPTKKDARIEALVQPLIGSATPGMAVVVLSKGDVVHAASYGTADIARKLPFTLESPTYIASLGKMFTAFGILQLIDQGKLTFDTRLGDVLPTTPAYAKHVTIKQVLQHASGLPDHFDLDTTATSFSNADVFRLLNGAPGLLFAPDEKSSYSNSGYVLLAHVIARVSGMPYDRYVIEHFFAPAGMRNATVITGPQDLPAARVRGYAHKDSAFVLSDYEPPADANVGAGGMYASAADLYRWALALRKGGFVQPSSMKAASTHAVRSNGRPTEWGMGWLAESHGARDPMAGKEYVAAVGSLRGFRALLKWYQNEDLVIIWVANSDDNEVFDAMHKIAGLMLR